jgi:choline kinase
MKDVDATWILNPTEDISTSGSGHSTWFAWQASHNILDDASRVVLMDADVLYDPALFQLLRNADPTLGSKTLVCSDYRETNEEVMVFAPAGGKPALHGKGLLQTPLTEGLTCLGEASGILLWEPQDHAALKSVTEWVMRYSTAKARSEHEDITQRMMSIGKVQCVPFSREYDFMECDTPEEYTELREVMYPKIKGKVSFRDKL